MRSGTHRRNRVWAIVLAAATLVGVGSTANAANHLWDLSELYSNASGTVQFVEMHDEFDGEGFLNGTTLTARNADSSQTHIFTFPGNLSELFETADHHLLIATAGFGSLPGGVTPDYTLPPNFLFTGGGSLTFSASGDSVTYGSLPTDGTNSLTIDVTVEPHTPGAAVNSPTNFAGATGSVPEPTSWLAAAAPGLAWTAGRRPSRRGGR